MNQPESTVVTFRTSGVRKSLYEIEAQRDGSASVSQWLRSLADRRIAERTLAELATGGER